MSGIKTQIPEQDELAAYEPEPWACTPEGKERAEQIIKDYYGNMDAIIAMVMEKKDD